MLSATEVLSIVGVHFATGHRVTGAVLLILLALSPFLAGAVVSLLFPELVVTGQSKGVFAMSYIFIAVAVWLSSMVIARHAGPGYPKRKIEGLLASIVAWGLLLFGVVTMVVVPLAAVEAQGTASSRVGMNYKAMPASDGSLVVQGLIERRGVPLANEQLRLLFNEGQASPLLTSDEKGEFTYRLPAGTWRFVGPLIASKPNAPVRYELNAPFDPLNRTISVARGPANTSTKIIVTVD